jgi:hypothetical protein
MQVRGGGHQHERPEGSGGEPVHQAEGHHQDRGGNCTANHDHQRAWYVQSSCVPIKLFTLLFPSITYRKQRFRSGFTESESDID